MVMLTWPMGPKMGDIATAIDGFGDGGLRTATVRDREGDDPVEHHDSPSSMSLLPQPGPPSSPPHIAALEPPAPPEPPAMTNARHPNPEPEAPTIQEPPPLPPPAALPPPLAPPSPKPFPAMSAGPIAPPPPSPALSASTAGGRTRRSAPYRPQNESFKFGKCFIALGHKSMSAEDVGLQNALTIR